ncbi:MULTISPECIES: histidine phosphatase family protein [Rhodococcus]|uniref:histidine phosphatase family protein n=1 Tax=Rhodococcus TaxID=1827 RepID=UPI0035B529F5
MPGGPDGHDFFRGYDSVIDEIAGRGCATAAVVSHGAAIRTWVAARTSNVDVRFAAANTLANTDIVVLDGSPATGWRVDSWTNAAVPDRTGKADLSRYPTNSVGSF